MIKLSPQQVQSIVGVSRDTLRHWRTVLPPIKEHNGYSACFSASEVLAIMVINVLVKDFQVRVSALIPLSLDLFQICNGANWHKLHGSKLLINEGFRKVKIHPIESLLDISGAVIVLPLGLMIDHLQKELLGDNLPVQVEMGSTPLTLPKEQVAR